MYSRSCTHLSLMILSSLFYWMLSTMSKGITPKALLFCQA